MAQVFANNAFSYLTGDIDATAQDVTIRTADAALFPQPDQAKGETFMVTLENRATNKIEITECFRRVGATLSLRRGREGSSPEAFASGSTVSNRLTAGVIQGGLLGWAEFNRRYLGAYATQPTLDPLGFPLQRGALMYDLNTDAIFVFTTDGWTKWSPSGDLQTGIPPGGNAGDSLTRNSEGLIEWRPTVDVNARDVAQLARDAAAAAQTTASQAVTVAGDKVSKGGDTMTGSLVLSPPADLNGNSYPLMQLNSRGSGSAYLRHSKASTVFADLILGSDGVPTYARYNTNGTLASNRRILLEGDALNVAGGVVLGATTFGASAPLALNAMLTAAAGATVRDLHLIGTGAEGGQILFDGNIGGLALYNDIADNHLRWFRAADSAMLMSLNLVSGVLNVNNRITSGGQINAAGDISTPGAVYANFFRMANDGDTGLDGSGDGYATLLNNGQPTLQTQPGGNVYVWGNLTAFSDKRMKEDIGVIEDPLVLVEQMLGVTFVKKGDSERRRQVGFIAQDVEEVLPDLIQRSQDGMLGVNYAAYVSVLNEAIKALHYKVRRLEAILHA